MTIQLPENIESFDYYKLFFDDNILKCIVIETNKNVEQSLNSNRITQKSRFCVWEPVTSEIMMKFIGLLV